MDETFHRPASLPERRTQGRQEMTAAILAASRAVMRRDGVAALNLNEVARMVGIQRHRPTPSASPSRPVNSVRVLILIVLGASSSP